MLKSRTFVKRNPIQIYSVLAFAIAIPTFALITPETPVAIQVILMFLGSYAPTVAALAVLDLSQDGEASQAFRKRVLNWRIHLKWYLLAILLPTGIWLISSVILQALDREIPAQFSLLAYLPVIYITNFGEEIGWRGFALPRLLTMLRPLPASLLLGLIWGLFHVPLYWGRPVYMALSFAMTTGIAIILTWLFLNAGSSVLLFTLFHAIYNAWGQAYLSGENAEIVLGVSIAVLWGFVGMLILRYGSRLVQAPRIKTDKEGAS